MTSSGAAPPDAPQVASANLRLRVGNLTVQGRITVATGPVKPQAVLPALQNLVNAVVAASEQELADTGYSVSCKAGCGACCRQPVPISAPEAYFIRDLVEAMPEPRRTAVKARFSAARERLQAAGLHDAAMHLGQMSVPDLQRLDAAYFDLGLACPFLEDESCSIHADRPLICREYLVTSPAERCARPHAGGIERVAIPKLSLLLHPIGATAKGDSTMALSVALDWADAHPDTLPLHKGTDWVQYFLSRLGGLPASSAPPPPPAKPATDGDVVAGVRLPTGDVAASAMLPVIQALADEGVRAAIAEVEAIGDRVSCRAGCNACCHHLVTVSVAEAHQLADVVARLPEPRQAAARRRFAAAGQVISGWDRVGELDHLLATAESKPDLEPAFMALGLACPLLEEDGRCAIYEERPLVCREYLVTSDPKHCAFKDDDDARHLRRLPVAMVATAAAQLELADDAPRHYDRIDVFRALAWVAGHPDTSPRLPARRWLERFALRLGESQAAAAVTGRRIPEVPALVPFGGRGPKPAEDDVGPGFDIPMPPGAVSAEAMLPSFRAYTDALVANAVEQVVAAGKSVSCRAGCGACCSQSVPISTVEARRLAALVEAMPEPRRSEIRHRFAETERRIAESDLAADYDRWVTHSSARDRHIPHDYFKLDIPCPFLEAGSCSIYEERPLVCREYLVTTPAENCSRYGDPTTSIELVPSAFTHLALRHLETPSGARTAETVPLSRALSWAAAHPAPDAPLHPAQVWMNRFLHRLENVKNYGYAVRSLTEDGAQTSNPAGAETKRR